MNNTWTIMKRVTLRTALVIISATLATQEAQSRDGTVKAKIDLKEENPSLYCRPQRENTVGIISPRNEMTASKKGILSKEMQPGNGTMIYTK